MADDDPNNPQRAEVLRRERERIEQTWWMQTRLEAVLRDAAAIALCPNYVVTLDNFTLLARQAYVDTRTEFENRVRHTVAQRAAVLSDSPTAPTNEEKPS